MSNPYAPHPGMTRHQRQIRMNVRKFMLTATKAELEKEKLRINCRMPQHPTMDQWAEMNAVLELIYEIKEQAEQEALAAIKRRNA